MLALRYITFQDGCKFAGLNSFLERKKKKQRGGRDKKAKGIYSDKNSHSCIFKRGIEKKGERETEREEYAGRQDSIALLHPEFSPCVHSLEFHNWSSHELLFERLYSASKFTSYTRCSIVCVFNEKNS